MNREESVQHFLDLIKKSRRGKFKIYIGMIAGVGKSYRMLQEAHDLLDNGVDVQIGYVETHGRAGRYSTRQRNWKRWIWRALSVSTPILSL